MPTFITYDDTLREILEDWTTDRYLEFDLIEESDDGRYDEEYCFIMRWGLADFPNFKQRENARIVCFTFQELDTSNKPPYFSGENVPGEYRIYSDERLDVEFKGIDPEGQYIYIYFLLDSSSTGAN